MLGAWITVALLADAACVALLACWSVGLFQFVRTVRRVPTARAGLGVALPAEPPSVCVVIPAHNEAGNMAALVGSLRGQDYPRLRVVLGLDRCTDGTARAARAAIAGDERFEIVEIAACPEGWAGKVNAVWRGVRESASARAADVLLFADADCVFDPGCVRATVALMRSRGLDLLSLLSTLTHDSWFERVVQPAATLETVTQYPLLRAGRAARRRAFANGQFMMFTRAAYEAVGGHEAVKDALLEDLALSRLVSRQDRPAAVMVADGMVTCRMYQTWTEFRRGWKRIYTELASRKADRLVRHAWRVRAMSVLLPLIAAANIVACLFDPAELGGAWRAAGVGLGVLGLGVMFTVMAMLYRLGRTPLVYLPGYVVGAAFVSGLLSAAAADLRAGRAIKWAGREYVLGTR